ncbi:beta strand repeat-containing protein [Roseovarius mucosus]|uniref:beta strand repeat-containing protein n=1 Tax=Roseovarius mucosus TaxID=215743 RepID=UPI003BA9DEDB
MLYWENTGGQDVFLTARAPSGGSATQIGAFGGLPVTAGSFADGVLLSDTSADADSNLAVAFDHGDAFLNAADTDVDQTLTVTGIDPDVTAGEVRVSNGTTTIILPFDLGTIENGIATVTLPANSLDFLDDGTLTATVEVQDLNGNVATASDTIALDTTADAAPNLSVAFEGAGVDDSTFNAGEAIQVAFSGIDADATGTLTITSTGGGSVVVAGLTSVSSSPISLDSMQMDALSDGTLSVTLAVTDTAGNTAQVQSNGFDLDASAPMIASVTLAGGSGVEGTVIDGDVGGFVTLTIAFNEAMDTAVDPTVTLDTASASSFTEAERAWSMDGLSLTITYTVVDQNVDLAAITVGVSGAQDVAGNVISAVSEVATGTAIDTESTASETESVTIAEIPDQDAATTGTPIVLAKLSGADGTTYALTGEAAVNAHVEIVSDGEDGFMVQIIDTEAARGFFDLEENGPSFDISVTGTDNAGNTTASVLSITLTDLNDAPELVPGENDLTGTVIEREDGVLGENATPFGTTGTFGVHDDDVANSHSVTVSNISSTNGTFLGVFQAGFSDPIQGDGNGTVQWTFNIGAPITNPTTLAAQMAIVDALADGESITQVYDVTTTETVGGLSFVQRIMVTIEGSNDAPVISGTAVSAELTEVVDDGSSDPSLTATGMLTVVDTDTSDTVTVAVSSVATSGSFAGTNPLDNATLLAMLEVVAGDGTVGLLGSETAAMAADATAGSDFTWQFSAGNPESSPFDFLPAGETLILEYTLTATDDSETANATDTQVVTITITGTNDVPQIGASSTAATTVVEAGGVENGGEGTAEATGNLSADGNWTDADDGEAAALVVSEIAFGETSVAVAVEGETEIAGTYGSLFVSADGSYRYVLDNTLAATQALNADQAVTEVFDYTIANNGGGLGNEASATLTVNITGANDTPVISFGEGQDVGTVEEAGVNAENEAINTPPTTATGTLSADDVDAEDAPVDLIWSAGADTMAGQAQTDSLTVEGVYGSFAVDASGNWTFTLDNTAEAVQSLHDSESVLETFTVTVTDDRGATSTQDVVITINGTNDAPVIVANEGADTSVTEQDGSADPKLEPEGPLSSGDPDASGSFSVSDVDTGGTDQVIWSITGVNGEAIEHSVANGSAAEAVGTYGFLVLNSDGEWSYQLDDRDEDTQALAAGVVVTDTFTVRVADGLGGYSEDTVTVTVTGSNDAPVIELFGGELSGPLGPDSTLGNVLESDAANLTASGTLTVSDVDANDSVAISVTAVSASGTLGGFEEDDAALQAMMTISGGTPLETGAGNASGQITWSFDSGSETFDYLAAGESITLNFTVTADDGDATDTETVTVRVNGTNDRPEIVIGDGDSATGELTESTGLMGETLDTAGTLSIADADLSDAHSVSASRVSVTWTDVNGADNLGTASDVTPLPEDLEAALDAAFAAAINLGDPRQVDWSFSLADSLADFLGAGETLTVVYDVTVNDGGAFDGTDEDGNENSVSAVQKVTITITGTNDAPVVVADETNEFAEGDALVIDENSVLDQVALTPEATVTVNLLGTGDDSDDEIWVTTVTELDANDTRAITGTTSVSASGNIPTGFVAADAQAAFDLSDALNGVVTFDRNAAVFDALDTGEFIDVALTYTVTTTSPDGTTTTDNEVTTIIRVTGANDAPYIVEEDDFAASVTELPDLDAGENAARPTVNGSITFNDVDPGDLSALQVTVEPVQDVGEGAALLANYVGTFSAGFVAPTGTSVAGAGEVFYSFDLDDLVLDTLTEGETFTQSYQVSISDGTATTSRNIVLTFTGTNDAPVITAATGDLALTEDQGDVASGSVTTQTLTGTISFDDADTSTLPASGGAGGADTHTVTAEVTSVALDSEVDEAYEGPTGSLSFDATAANASDAVGNTVGWSFEITDGQFDFLAAGEVLSITYTVTVEDNNGGTDTQDITFTITGTNDLPVINVAESDVEISGNEDAVGISGTVLATDVDGDELSFALADGGSPENGSVTVNTDGTYTYVPNADFNGTDAFTVAVSDGNGGTDTVEVSVTVNAVNDAPVNTVPETLSTDEDTAVALTGLSVSDVDAGEGTITVTLAVAEGAGTIAALEAGSVTVAGSGTNSITLTGTLADINAYLATETTPVFTPAQDANADVTLTMTTDDGGSTGEGGALTDIDTVTITVNPVNDAPVVEGPVSAEQTEDAEGFTVNLLSGASDVDTGDLLTVSGLTLDSGDDSGVTVSLDGNSLTVDPDAYTALAVGESAVITYSYTVTDGNGGEVSQTATITITGANDGPVLEDVTTAPAIVDTAGDDTLSSVSDTLVGSDVDNGAVLTYAISGQEPVMGETSLEGKYGTLTVLSDGSYTYTPDAAKLQGLAADAEPNETFTIVVTDEHGAFDTATLTVDITPANDTPELAAVDAINITDTAAADDFAAQGGTLSATDRDSGHVDAMVYSIAGQEVAEGATSQTFYFDRVGNAVVTEAPLNGVELGTLTVQSSGAYSFEPNDAGINSLRADQNPVITTTLRATDPQGATSETGLVINIDGVNDNPTITGTDPEVDQGVVNVAAKEQAEADEGDLVVVSGTISFADVDSNGIPSFGFAALAPGFVGTIQFSPSGETVDEGTFTWTFSIPDATLNALAEGEALGTSPQVYDITVNDGDGGSVVQRVSIAIVGTNDAPVIAGALGGGLAISGAATEAADGAMDAAITTSGTLSVSDEDTRDEVTVSVTGAVVSGGTFAGTVPLDSAALAAMMQLAAGTAAETGFGDTVVLGADGTGSDFTWAFTSGSSGDAAFDFLAAGETLVVTYTLTADDLSETDSATDTQTVTITITGTNDSPVALAADGVTVAEDLDAATVIATASGTDVDLSDVLSYSISAGNDAGLFEIDATTGDISLVAGQSLDAETEVEHVLTVTVSDGNGGTDTQEITVNVTDVDDNLTTAPVDADGVAGGSVDENAKLGTVGITAASTDADITSGAITYAIVGGTGATDFVIDAETGVVSVASGANIDRETGSSLTIDVQATPANGAASVTSTFTITINDVNEFDVSTPVDSNAAANEVSENAGPGTLVGIVASASDADATTNGVTFSLTDSAGGIFEIDAATGEVRLSTAAMAPRPDFETAESHTITVQAMSADGSISTEDFTITILDANDTAPVFAINAAQSVAENETSVVRLSATDVDTDQSGISFTIVGGDDQAAFRVVEDEGVYTLEFISAPDFEMPTDMGGNNIYNVVVEAFDGTNMTEQAFAITVTDVNEAPTAVSLDNTTATLAENSVIGSGIKVADITITDDALGVNGVTLTGADAAFFAVVSTDTGLELHYVGEAPNFEAPADAGADNSFNVTVEVDDGTVGDTPDATTDFTLTVTDVNEAPVANQVPAETFPVVIEDEVFNGLVVSEFGEAFGEIPLSVFASDVDGNIDPSSLSIDGVTVEGNVVTQAEAGISYSGETGAFSVNAATEVYQSLDVDEEISVVVSFTVTDSEGLSDNTGTITFTVRGTNDAPVIVVAESDITGTGAEDEGAITGTIVADDVDDGAILGFSIEDGDSAANGSVTVDPNTGTWSYTPDANFNGVDSFTVTVSDGLGGSVTQVVDVTVTAVNDATEIDVSSQVAATHVEAVDAAAPVATLVAAQASLTDVDALDYDTGTFTASVVDGDATDLLDLDTSGSVSVVDGAVSVGGTQVGTVTGQGTATLSVSFLAAAFAADVQAVINALSYATTDATPVTSREITLDLTDGDGAAAEQQTISVSITATNDSPIAVNDAFGVTEGSFASAFNVLSIGTADSDPENDTLSVTALADLADGAQPVGGSATVGASAGVITTDWGAEVTLQSNGQLFYNLTSSTARFNELAAGETAVDSFTYTVSDGNGGTDTATVSVTITGVNDAILAAPDTITATEDTAASVAGNLLANDTDVDINDIPTIVDASSSVTATAVATADGFRITTIDGVVVNLSANGDYTLTAPDSLAAGVTSTATFQYTVQDSGSAQSTTTVTVQVTGDNDAPTAVQVTLLASNEDTVRIITEAQLLSGASDVDTGAVLEITALALTSGNGSLVDNEDGTWTYTPDLNDNGDVTFSYTVSDGLLTATASATLDLLPVNDAPVAQADAAISTGEDQAISGTVTATDVDGDSLSFALASGGAPANGSVTVSANGGYTYTPDADFNGTDAFTVSVTDGNGGTDTVVVNVTVNAVNDAPVAQADAAISTGEDQAISGTVTATDVDGDSLSFALASGGAPANGSVTVSANGGYTYTPDADFNGTDAFTVSVTDGNGGTDTVVVNVTVNAVNDAPVAQADAAISTGEDQAISGTVTATDVDGDSLSFALASGGAPANGSVTVSANGGYTYTPDADFNGTDAFTVSVTDGNGGTDTVVVSVTVNAVNDAPVAQADAAISTGEDQAISGTVTATDVDGDSLSFALASGGAPANGSVTVSANGGYTYTPDADFNGTDAFTVSVTDGNGGTDTVVVSVTVNAVNDAPVAQADAAISTGEDQAISGTVTATDVDGDSLSFALASGGAPANGSVTVSANGGYTYTPDADFNGTDAFTVSVTDGNGGTDTVVVSVTVNAVNDAPVAQADAAISTGEDQAISGTVTATDVDGDSLSFALATGGAPANGSVTVSANGGYTYTPDADFNGTDAFTVSVTDGNGGTDTVVVNVTVNAVNDAPVAQADAAISTGEDQAISGTVTATDVDGDSLSFALASGGAPANGSVTVSANGGYTYTPDADFNGTDAFTVSVTDGNGGTDTVVVSVTVNAVNDAPVAQADAAISTGEDQAISGTVTATDVDGDSLSFALASGGAPANGSVTVSANGGYTYTPDADFNGTDAFTVSVTDGNGGTDTVVVSVTVNAVNDAPVVTLANVTTDVDEDADTTSRIKVADIVVSDDEQGINTLALVGADAALFEIVGTALFLRAGASLDFETKAQLDVSVTVNDASVGGTPDGTASLSLTVNDVEEGPVSTNENDTLIGSDGDDLIGGLDGDDSISGGLGSDSLFGEAGNDTLSGGDGNDTVAGGDGDDVVNGDAGNDSLGGGLGNDTLNGGDGNDTMGGGFGDDLLSGGTGADVVAGGAGNDTLDGGDGNDSISGSFGNDVINGGVGNDQIGGGAGRDTIDGGAGNDQIGGGEGDDDISGGAGNDFLAGGGRNDVIDGGTGNDTINGGAGNDIMTGGADADIFVFSAFVDGELDVITDFEDGTDRLLIRIVNPDTGEVNISNGGNGLQGFVDALGITQADEGAQINVNGQIILLEGVDASVLGVDDFQFL